MKRIVICGSREYENYEEARLFLEETIGDMEKSDVVILSGTCRGADRLGERFAKEKGYSVEYYPAEWKKYGKGAGIRRNQEMAKQCDVAICFWDGKSRGTASLINFAKTMKKQVYIKKVL